ncbi:sugar transferase [Companilactobacillus zhongbaensis]|uniref:sugar transferase n=1 Tax=Companilactobacillus zhongbaensis TaxID=2486009 RepID=UPI000F77EA32|nr:sugar transferase [Companilactobacillus zhongbaensis]
MDYTNDRHKSDNIKFSYHREKCFYKIVKRSFDFVASLLGLILLLPLFLIVAIAIKLEDSAGAVFYSQTRIGKNKKPFKMYKFRSMTVDADERLKELLDKNEIEGAMFKMKEDPRVTKVGAFIRKYSIDELPQLFNVLRGNMSLVGPRPPLPYEVEKYTDHDLLRLIVKPGCTGLWQISGRNAVGFHEMVEMDLQYIAKCGFLFDIYVLFKTVAVFIHPNAAY